MGKAGGIFSTIVGMAALTALAILIAAPLGVGTAIYLTEYTRGGRLTRVIRFGAECLAGIPSIIFGLFGFILFVNQAQIRLVDPQRRPDPGLHAPADHHPDVGGGHQSVPRPTGPSAFRSAARNGRP